MGQLLLWTKPDKSAGNRCWNCSRFVPDGQRTVPILSGDTHQHEAVEASDALRAIEQYSGLDYAELTNIRCQNPGSAKNQTERRWLE